MTLHWIAWRVIREITRDRRTLAFFFLVPLVVMTLVYYAIAEDEVAKVGVVTRGAARLFEGDLVNALEGEDDVEVVTLAIPDRETDPEVLKRLILKSLRTGEADGILYLDQELLVQRFDGMRGELNLYLEGSRPTRTAAVASAMSGAMDDLAASLPVVIDSSCSSMCANSVNNKPMDLVKHYLYGSEDYRLVDFFLPVFPPFFVFFFTFIIATITFQRERMQGTLARLLMAPVNFAQVVLGYVAGFLIFSGAQAAIVLAFVLTLISFPITGPQLGAIVLMTLLLLLLALVLGLLASFMAHNEFQAVQFIPLIILPQIFLSDMIWDISSFPEVLRWVAYILPLTYANSAMRDVLLKGQPLWEVWPQIGALCIFFAVLLALLTFVATRPRQSL